jgi:hypothetical protein
MRKQKTLFRGFFVKWEEDYRRFFGAAFFLPFFFGAAFFLAFFFAAMRFKDQFVDNIYSRRRRACKRNLIIGHISHTRNIFLHYVVDNFF